MNTRFLFRRTGQALMTVVIVVTISFLLTRLLPGWAGMINCLPGSNPGNGAGCQVPTDVAGPAIGEIVVMLAILVVLFIIAGAVQTTLD